MILRRPPLLADWLLKRFHVADVNASVIGDLLEEFQAGRSRAWYWRQTIGAIAATLWHNIRHSGDYLTVIFAAWAFQVTVSFMLWAFHLPKGPVVLNTTYTVLAIIVLITHFLMLVLVLGKSGTEKLKRALGRLFFWCLLPFLTLLSELMFYFSKKKWQREALPSDIIGIKITALAMHSLDGSVRFVRDLGVYCALCWIWRRLSLDEFAILEIWLLIRGLISGMFRPSIARPN
jgi:hypothetical protein